MKFHSMAVRSGTLHANPDDPTEPGYGTTQDVRMWALFLTFGDEANPKDMRQLGLYLPEQAWNAECVADLLEQTAQKIRAARAGAG